MLRGISKAIAIVSLLAGLPTFASELKVETLVEGAGSQAEKNRKSLFIMKGGLKTAPFLTPPNPEANPLVLP